MLRENCLTIELEGSLCVNVLVLTTWFKSNLIKEAVQLLEDEVGLASAIHITALLSVEVEGLKVSQDPVEVIFQPTLAESVTVKSEFSPFAEILVVGFQEGAALTTPPF